MPRLKYYNPATEQWEYVVVGAQGDTGPAGPGVAPGGTEGQILLKVDGTDYNTTWADNNAESTFYLVRNNTGITIPKGTLVAATGAEPSGRIDVAPFEVTGLENSELRVMGVATANISSGVNGTVMSFGTLKGLDTRGTASSAIAVGDEDWPAGTILYAHPTVPGKLTSVKPQHDLVVAFTTVRHASTGQMAIRITSGTHLEWLHDVEIEDPADQQILSYNESTGLWQNIDIPESAGIVVSATAPEETTSIWYNNENGNAYIYYDDFWTSISGASGMPIVSDTAPDSPVTGMQWFNSSNGKTYLYYSGAWIEVDSNGTAAQPSGNAIINGAFDIWQRGTSFTQVGTSDIYSADRWQLDVGGDAAGSLTCSRQTFTPAELNIVGFGEAQFYARLTQNVVGSSTRFNIKQKIEDVRTFAGQTITLSFWAKANNAFTLLSSFDQDFGSGGSAVVTTTGPSFSVTTSWQRFSGTISLPSISGKTVGTSSFLQLYFNFPPDTASDTFDIFGVQLEAGAVATPFKRNAPSIQAELAACQRYYISYGGDQVYETIAHGQAASSTAAYFRVVLPVPMRVTPTLSVSNLSDWQIVLLGLIGVVMTSLTISTTESSTKLVALNTSFGSNGNFGSHKSVVLVANNALNARIGLSAEL